MKKRKKRSTFRSRPVGPFKKRSGARSDLRVEDFDNLVAAMNQSIQRFISLLGHKFGSVFV
ncbi:hypothetical protein [Acetobacter cibinongensis]|uniref:Uncharacterized protein n=1 Tax=Acetobacter cibinongensis TaxID=146475 RepID=A0A1Z5YRK7_9PROT|nr:hypothetical protein [Acetobacter cibinongensis]OUI99536.1 hypothetical protein HK14_14160 [Acetobacter cibinongensis]